jgi:hypothetical protein
VLFGGDRDLLDRVLGAADLDRGLVALVEDLAVVIQRSEPRLGTLQKELLGDRATHGRDALPNRWPKTLSSQRLDSSSALERLMCNQHKPIQQQERVNPNRACSACRL